MEQFQIETAQNISIAQNTAHLGDRMLAFLIDSFVIASYWIVVFFVSVSLNIDEKDMWTIMMLFGLLPFLYYLLMEALMNGKTIGKHFMQLRVVKLDGSKPTFIDYAIRWLLRIIDISLSAGGLAVFTILIRGKGQRVGDIAAGTTVISEKKRIQLSDTLLRDLPTDYKPHFPQVTVFNDHDMQTIKELYDDAKRNGSHQIILRLSNQIKQVTEISSEMKPIDFVDIIIKDYNYYTQQY